MDEIFFSDWKSIGRIIIMSVCAYPALIFILRVSGKRTLSKMNAFDLIVTIALGSTLATVILNKDISLAEGILTFVLLVAFQFAITFWSARSEKINQIVKSSPTLLAYKGELIKQNMRSERINEDEIWSSLRESGLSSLAECDAVILETDGSLTVVNSIGNPNDHAVKKVLGSAGEG